MCAVVLADCFEVNMLEPKAYGIDSSVELSLSVGSYVEVIPDVRCPLLAPISPMAHCHDKNQHKIGLGDHDTR